LLAKAREAGLLTVAVAATASDLAFWLAEKPDAVALWDTVAAPEGAEPLLLRIRERDPAPDHESTLLLA
jgi:hypothetical protein